MEKEPVTRTTVSLTDADKKLLLKAKRKLAKKYGPLTTTGVIRAALCLVVRP